MTAPTEAEIRAAIDRRLDESISGTVGGGLRAELRNLCREAGSSMQWPVDWSLDLVNDPLWNDVEPSAEEGLYGALSRTQALAFDDHLRIATRRAADRCEAIILEELTAAGLRFAAEYPDAPRARVAEPVA
jgi:hypothetical protein